MTGRSPSRRGSRAGARALLATTALGAALCSVGALPAVAATEQEAENLRRDLEAFLADPGQTGYTFEHGAVTAEVVDDGYNLLVPDLVLVYDQPPAQVSYGEPISYRVHFDDLSLRLVPDPVDLTQFGIQARLGGGSLFGTSGGPLRIIIEGRDDARAFVDVGKNELTGTWSSEIGYLTAAAITLTDIVATPDPAAPDAPDARISIGAIRGISDLAESAPGLWGGTGETSLENLVVEVDGEVPIRLGQFTLHQSIGGFAFDDYMQWIRANPVMMGEEPQFTTEAEAEAFFQDLVVNFPTILDDFSMGWTLTDLDAGEGAQRVLIERHEFEIGATGLAGDISDWTVRAFAQGMSVPTPEVPSQFVPTVLDVNLHFRNVPTGLAWQAMETAVQSTGLQDMDQIGPMLGQEMMQLTMQSQTGIDLGGEIDWETGNVQFTGDIKADPTSPVMASGGLRVVVGEMQEFIREVESAMGPDAAGGLTMFQALGQQEGNTTVYDFQISGSSVLMNGQDMGPLMMMLDQ